MHSYTFEGRLRLVDRVIMTSFQWWQWHMKWPALFYPSPSQNAFRHQSKWHFCIQPQCVHFHLQDDQMFFAKIRSFFAKNRKFCNEQISDFGKKLQVSMTNHKFSGKKLQIFLVNHRFSLVLWIKLYFFFRCNIFCHNFFDQVLKQVENVEGGTWICAEST